MFFVFVLDVYPASLWGMLQCYLLCLAICCYCLDSWTVMIMLVWWWSQDKVWMWSWLNTGWCLSVAMIELSFCCDDGWTQPNVLVWQWLNCHSAAVMNEDRMTFGCCNDWTHDVLVWQWLNCHSAAMMIDTGCCFDVAMIEQMSLGYGDAHWGCGSESTDVIWLLYDWKEGVCG